MDIKSSSFSRRPRLLFYAVVLIQSLIVVGLLTLLSLDSAYLSLGLVGGLGVIKVMLGLAGCVKQQDKRLIGAYSVLCFLWGMLCSVELVMVMKYLSLPATPLSGSNLRMLMIGGTMTVPQLYSAQQVRIMGIVYPTLYAVGAALDLFGMVLAILISSKRYANVAFDSQSGKLQPSGALQPATSSAYFVKQQQYPQGLNAPAEDWRPPSHVISIALANSSPAAVSKLEPDGQAHQTADTGMSESRDVYGTTLRDNNITAPYSRPSSIFSKEMPSLYGGSLRNQGHYALDTDTDSPSPMIARMGKGTAAAVLSPTREQQVAAERARKEFGVTSLSPSQYSNSQYVGGGNGTISTRDLNQTLRTAANTEQPSFDVDTDSWYSRYYGDVYDDGDVGGASRRTSRQRTSGINLPPTDRKSTHGREKNGEALLKSRKSVVDTGLAGLIPNYSGTEASPNVGRASTKHRRQQDLYPPQSQPRQAQNMKTSVSRISTPGKEGRIGTIRPLMLRQTRYEEQDQAERETAIEEPQTHLGQTMENSRNSDTMYQPYL